MYYESHINIDLVDGSNDSLDDVCRVYRMKRSNMDGNTHTTKRETILTGHGQDLEALEERVKGAVLVLKAKGFTVTRYKIEKAIVDSRASDVWGLLSGDFRLMKMGRFDVQGLIPRDAMSIALSKGYSGFELDLDTDKGVRSEWIEMADRVILGGVVIKDRNGLLESAT